MIPNIEDEEIRKNLNEIHETVDKIIITISTKPNKKKKVSNFFDYYLPVTVKILQRYDEIENQRLVSDDGKNFMIQSKKMIVEINNAFKKQLSSLYQSDMIDQDAEMKVFDSMLKADGYNDDDFNV